LIIKRLRGSARLLGFSMRCANLTDDDLWSGIAENTNAMSLLFHENRVLDAIDIDVSDRILASDRCRLWEDLMRSHMMTLVKLMREYDEYTTELRRRHSLG
jgi:hypothetical protein